MSDFERITVERDNHVLLIGFNRPEKRNALSLEVLTELRDAVREAGESDALAVVLAVLGTPQ